MIDETTRWSQCKDVNQSIYDFQVVNAKIVKIIRNIMARLNGLVELKLSQL